MRPVVVRECSACLGLMYQQSRPLGAFYQPILWTDGKLSNLNRLADPKIAVCPHCQALLWIYEMKQQGDEITGPEQLREKGEKVIPLQEPTFKQYATLLEQGAVAGAKERQARFGLWWAGNDMRRRPDSKAAGPGFRERANMAALAEMLDETVAQDLVLKAELMRELGLFPDARALLRKSVDEKQQPAADLIGRLISQGDTRVAMVGTVLSSPHLATVGHPRFHRRC
jgi:hypothetical protein